MRYRLVLLLLMFNLLCFSQLHIQKGTRFTIQGVDSFISTLEPINSINTTISGQGTLYLNSTSNQVLSSTQAVLELPNLVIKQADQLHLNTAVAIENKLQIKKGVLVLFYDLYLSDLSALVLGNESKLKETAKGNVLTLFKGLKSSHPMATELETLTVVFIRTKQDFKASRTLFVTAFKNNFEYYFSCCYKVYMSCFTPPPDIC